MAACTALALAVARVVPALPATTVAVVLGALLANAGLHRPVLHPGTRLARQRVLRVAVVLLGLQVSLPLLLSPGPVGLLVVVLTVAVTFAGAQALGRLLGVSPARSLLVATGFSICGASAVAAMQPVAKGDEEDAAVAVALVTLCGTLAIVVLPLLRGPLGLDPAAFGAWVGASVHDVGQTVATADRVPGALRTAVVVKLTRVLLLAPLVAGVALAYRRRGEHAEHGEHGGPGVRRPPLVPLFVAGFVAAVLVGAVVPLPAGLLAAARAVQGVLLTAALVGLGTGISVASLKRTGGRALALGLAAWVLVAGVAYAGLGALSGAGG